MKIEIHNGRLIDPAHGVDRKTSLYIAAGKVAAIDEPPAGWNANRTIDATGLVVCPGLIDLSARLREPGFEYKATLESEMRAAVAGGVTSLACPPDTDPPLDEPGLVEMLKHRARSLNQAHVYPVGALTVALKGDAIFELVRATGVRVHLARLSTHEGVARVRAAKKEGLPVTCDVAVHHVHLCEVDIGWFDAHCRLVPPLRATRDRAALRAGLADGTIDLICSDHAPVDDDGKQLPFAEAEPGATGLELLLPLTLKWAQEEKIALPAALARITSEPARVLGLASGNLASGAEADVCVFDPDTYWKVEPASLKSQGKNTPFLGLELPGKVRYTLVGGQVVHESAG